MDTTPPGTPVRTTDFTLPALAVGIDALMMNEPTQGSKAILSPHKSSPFPPFALDIY